MGFVYVLPVLTVRKNKIENLKNKSIKIQLRQIPGTYLAKYKSYYCGSRFRFLSPRLT